jgi:hypothetical protein
VLIVGEDVIRQLVLPREPESATKALGVEIRGSGKVRQPLGKARRVGTDPKRVNVDFPAWMVDALDREARRR